MLLMAVEVMILMLTLSKEGGVEADLFAVFLNELLLGVGFQSTRNACCIDGKSKSHKSRRPTRPCQSALVKIEVIKQATISQKAARLEGQAVSSQIETSQKGLLRQY
ncbi:hypothetical protein TcWFU_007073 [Taenia crassiceps]|uniref:Secreted protein n=1 Tax=Taenia crassiceps TaxID=6207 RepID=A0ABR4QNF6_9CEST